MRHTTQAATLGQLLPHRVDQAERNLHRSVAASVRILWL